MSRPTPAGAPEADAATQEGTMIKSTIAYIRYVLTTLACAGFGINIGN